MQAAAAGEASNAALTWRARRRAVTPAERGASSRADEQGASGNSPVCRRLARPGWRPACQAGGRKATCVFQEPRIRSERARGSRYQLIAYQDPEQTKAIKVRLQLWGRTQPRRREATRRFPLHRTSWSNKEDLISTTDQDLSRGFRALHLQREVEKVSADV